MAISSKQGTTEFEEMHMKVIWSEQKMRFGFNLNYWMVEFNKHLDKQPRNVEVISVFYRFGNDRINPILNSILGRNSGFPTFNNLCDWVVTGKRKR